MAIRFYVWLDLPNFGDALSAAVAQWALGEEVAPVERTAAGKLLAVGSILQAARPGDVVWGSGVHPWGFEAFWRAFPPRQDIAVLAVRGPLTRDCLLARDIPCPEVFGDPAILLPRLHRPVARVAGRIGLVPHYSDLEAYRRWPPEGLELIDVTRPWSEVVDAIGACERVISSSLHGLIVAEAYGVPATWLRVGFEEGTIKFHDYYLGTGRIAQPAYGLEAARAGPPVPPPDLAPMADALLAALDRPLVRRRCAAGASAPSPATVAESPPSDATSALRTELAQARRELSQLRLAQFRFFDGSGRPCPLACVEGQAGAVLFEPPDWGPPTSWGPVSLVVRPELTLPGAVEWRRAGSLKFDLIIYLAGRLDREMALEVRLGDQETHTIILTHNGEEDHFYAYFLVPISEALRRRDVLTIAFALALQDAAPGSGPAALRMLSIAPIAQSGQTGVGTPAP